PVGTRLRRFGNEQGNLLHPDRTPFPETSLTFERESDLRTFVVTRPLHVLTGVTAPWGPLPGGAVAYLLPRPIGAHVESGARARACAVTPPGRCPGRRRRGGVRRRPRRVRADRGPGASP